MNKTRIAFIGGRGFKSSYGGVENAIREIVLEMTKIADLSNNNIELAVCGVTDPKHEGNHATPSNVRILGCPLWIYQKFGQHGLTVFGVVRLIFSYRPKVAIVFASGPCLFIPILRLFGIKVVSSLRAVDSHRDKWGKVSRTILKIGEYCAWRFAHVFTVNSKDMFNQFRHYRSDVIFLPNGARKATKGSYQYVMNILFDSPLQKERYFLFAARLDPVKRLHLLLQAHAQLKEEERLPLVVAGGHSKSTEYQDHLLEYADSKVLFVGHIDENLLAPLMRHCRAFILPSVLEGMSNSLLSAMASERAVIASNIPANRDVLNCDDATYEADNLNQLKHKLKQLAQNESFAKILGLRLAKQAEQHHCWARTSQLLFAQITPYLNLSSNLKGHPTYETD